MCVVSMSRNGESESVVPGSHSGKRMSIGRREYLWTILVMQQAPNARTKLKLRT